MKDQQLDLFSLLQPATAADIKWERFYGRMDAECGLPLVNGYSQKIAGERLEAYRSAFRARRLEMLA